MIGWLARMALLRVLPRKLIPLLTAIEVVRFVRAARRRSVGAAPAQAGRRAPRNVTPPDAAPRNVTPRDVTPPDAQARTAR